MANALPVIKPSPLLTAVKKRIMGMALKSASNEFHKEKEGARRFIEAARSRGGTFGTYRPSKENNWKDPITARQERVRVLLDRGATWDQISLGRNERDEWDVPEDGHGGPSYKYTKEEAKEKVLALDRTKTLFEALDPKIDDLIEQAIPVELEDYLKYNFDAGEFPKEETLESIIWKTWEPDPEIDSMGGPSIGAAVELKDFARGSERTEIRDDELQWIQNAIDNIEAAFPGIRGYESAWIEIVSDEAVKESKRPEFKGKFKKFLQGERFTETGEEIAINALYDAFSETLNGKNFSEMENVSSLHTADVVFNVTVPAPPNARASSLHTADVVFDVKERAISSLEEMAKESITMSLSAKNALAEFFKGTERRGRRMRGFNPKKAQSQLLTGKGSFEEFLGTFKTLVGRIPNEASRPRHKKGNKFTDRQFIAWQEKTKRRLASLFAKEWVERLRPDRAPPRNLPDKNYKRKTPEDSVRNAYEELLDLKKNGKLETIGLTEEDFEKIEAATRRYLGDNEIGFGSGDTWDNDYANQILEYIDRHFDK